FVLASKHRLLSLFLLLLAGLGMAVVLPDFLQQRFLTIVDSSYGPENAQQSAYGRVIGLMARLQVFGEHPLRGAGPAAFRHASGLGMNPHNLVAQILSELGLAGALAFLGILACFFANWWEAWQLRRRHPELAQDFSLLMVQVLTWTILIML